MNMWTGSREQRQILLSLLRATEAENQTIYRMPFVFSENL